MDSIHTMLELYRSLELFSNFVACFRSFDRQLSAFDGWLDIWGRIER